MEVLTAKIFFDSAFDPLPAGARSLDTNSRHVLCQADEYYVDCKMDYDRESRNVILVGQILHGDGALKELPVFLISDDRVVVSGTNRFGEFESTCHQAPVTLRLMVSEGKCLEVKVDLRQVGEGLSDVTATSTQERGGEQSSSLQDLTVIDAPDDEESSDE